MRVQRWRYRVSHGGYPGKGVLADRRLLAVPWQPVGHHVVYHVPLPPLLGLLQLVLVAGLCLEVEVVVAGVGLEGQRPERLLVSLLAPLALLRPATPAQVLRVNAGNGEV